ncbi:Coenzyme F420 hydrogenase/dehydrogenase, beta subunit C-terminal domain [Sedimentitalea sp. JM2-8]|uniref:Coenzyme F420 hydrogenase/dehydrogenase, beta subunit C-terminal domain n=1 Tax=Sedimentitalea xiamensis TaxID=3050037 RepID=A0ABT7FHJ3_9RHOB|nr:Coenzyme F420 hydrogenase/dehydrogenase, beta subunit C-terminal domain [Sedimentitalea xiamensis]MDK3074562.1 Coenzyme F420 hydrogenase/dehydrogenase, beta subunit C-terminal domain [Sedimentitalea xiamensis]
MVLDPPGYLRPHQTGALTSEEDALISRICPGLGQAVESGTRTDDVLWGPYLSLQTGFSTGTELRHAASSGGALSAVLVHLLQAKAIDAVIQTAASSQVPVANATVISTSVEDVTRAAGSRYAPSTPLAELADQLNDHRRFAFVGKPCDVAALRALAKEDPRVNDRFPVVLSFFCAGVPSQTGAEEILTGLGTDMAATTSFRYRGNGWPGRATARLKDGSERSMTYAESWGGILSKHVQLRCKICADGTGTAADLVFADAWHSDEKGYPLFEEHDGISLIVARTDRGSAILADAVATGHLETQPFDPSELAAIQPGQSGRRQALLARLLGLRLLGRPIPRYRGLHVLSAAKRNTLSSTLKNFFGVIRRGLTGRL